ncbi:MAG TPA: 1-acyl-sn-glycerol-3-phosphate acyltransferase [Thermoanaerobaculia bacterium]|nr:1-acyl-sn-glycerol-3-phosphate acyltransferase [Thermoanaerobaculia bacterium]
MRVFYRRVEIWGAERLPGSGPLIVCANHLNALADPIILQSFVSCPLHPLARSGLFRNPLMWPLLWLAGAIPVYRRRPERAGAAPGDSGRNDRTFRRATSLLAEGGAILIFPEGESHSDPRLKPLKTGAARIATAARLEHGLDVPLLPMSLTFTRRGRFRSSVLVQVGRPVSHRSASRESDPAAAVRELTEQVEEGLRAITLNVDSWADLDFLNRLDRFYRLRRGKRPDARPLARRFRSLQRMIAVHRSLRQRAPRQVESVRRRLRRFERLCRLLGARDDELVVEHRPLRFLLDLLPRLTPAILALPIAAAGWITSGPPFFLTRWLGPRMARRADQYDTSKILLGLVLFALWWGAQVWWVFETWGWRWALVWTALLGPIAAVAWTFARWRRRLLEELRAFVVLRSRRDASAYLRGRRDELQVEIAELARLAKTLPEPGRERDVELAS